MEKKLHLSNQLFIPLGGWVGVGVIIETVLTSHIELDVAQK